MSIFWERGVRGFVRKISTHRCWVFLLFVGVNGIWMIGIQLVSVWKRWNRKRYQNNRLRPHLSRSISLYDRPIKILSSLFNLLLALEVCSVLLSPMNAPCFTSPFMQKWARLTSIFESYTQAYTNHFQQTLISFGTQNTGIHSSPL